MSEIFIALNKSVACWIGCNESNCGRTKEGFLYKNQHFAMQLKLSGNLKQPSLVLVHSKKKYGVLDFAHQKYIHNFVSMQGRVIKLLNLLKYPSLHIKLFSLY